MTNVLQATSGGPGGSFTNNFTDRSGPLVSSAGDIVTLNYLDVGGATNSPATYYRIRVP